MNDHVLHCPPELATLKPAAQLQTMLAAMRHAAADPLFELDLELLLSTPASIVVRARADFDDGSASQEAGLVIARRDCVGDRPGVRALYWAALACAGRLARCGARPRRVRCVQARVGGGWVPVAAPALQEAQAA